MLTLISKYWGRPPAGVIECNVVRDLSRWPAGRLDPEGVAKIQEEAGVTLTQTLTLGGQKVAAKAVVYAVAKSGVAQHEAVHAYCGQSFGTCGPLWYAEGMAEMGQYWRPGEASVRIHPIVLEYLQNTRPQSLNDIVNTHSARNLTGDSWQNYAWRWALCHLLANNTNYRDRFRPLGLGFLTEQKVSFEETYGPMAKEISFEYLFFVGPHRARLPGRSLQLGLEEKIQGAARPHVGFRAGRGRPGLAAQRSDRPGRQGIRIQRRRHLASRQGTGRRHGRRRCFRRGTPDRRVVQRLRTQRTLCSRRVRQVHGAGGRAVVLALPKQVGRNRRQQGGRHRKDQAGRHGRPPAGSVRREEPIGRRRQSKRQSLARESSKEPPDAD